MRLEQKYIRRIPDALKAMGGAKRLVPILRTPESCQSRLVLAGFSEQLRPGEVIVPDARIGPTSRFNSAGRFIRHKDMPKEQCFRLHEWTYHQFHGTERIPITELVEIPYYRYPRTLIAPPSETLTIAVDETGAKMVRGPFVTLTEETRLLHAINLVLELAGRCEIVDENGQAILSAPEIRLDWDVFPAGKSPWEAVKPALERAIARERPGTRPLIWRRLEAIEKHRPSFRAVGRAGYSGYVVFGFEGLNLFICESTKSDNATYVFTEGWDYFTKLTKAEVILGKFAFRRLVHLQGWFDQIDSLFLEAQAA